MSWEDELDEFARTRGPALVGYGYLLTGELHAAQDLVQDAFVRTFARHRAGTDAARLEAYVRQAMLNIYRDSYRKRRRWYGVRPLVAERTTYGPPDAVAADKVDVHNALAHLSPRERACVVLRHYEDLTVPDIADRLGLSEGSVKRYLSDARARLGPLLDDDTHRHVDVVTPKEAKR